MPDLIDRLLFLILGGVLGAAISHFLREDGARGDRRRAFQAKLRELGARAREHHAMYLWQFYDGCREDVRSACIAAESDVPWGRKRKFRKLVERFLSLEGGDLRPPSTFSANDKETRKREFQQVCVNLEKLLKDLADAG